MKRAIIGALAAICALGAAGVTNDVVSNEARVKAWKRTNLTWDNVELKFNETNFPGSVEAAAAAEVALALPGLYDAAQTNLDAALAPAVAAVNAQSARPVVTVTGAVGFDNLLDRKNLFAAAVSNDWNAEHSKLTSYVFQNQITKLPPLVEARAITDFGAVTNWVDGKWADGWGNPTNAVDVTLTHQNSYTNFIIAPVTVESTMITNVEITVRWTDHEMQVVTNPISYYSVDYIETACAAGNNAYISTEYYNNPKTDFSIDFAFASLVYQQRMFGSGTSPYFEGYINGSGKFATAYSYPSGDWIASTKSATAYERVVLRMTAADGVVYINGVSNCTHAAISTRTSPSEIYLFAAARVPNSYASYMRLYACDISEDGTAVRKLRPVIDPATGEAGMIDLVSMNFHMNKGVGSFYYGGTPAAVYNPDIGARGYTFVTNYIEVAHTKTETLTLTNSVVVTVDGATPTIVLKGDTETFEAYPVVFDFGEPLAAEHTPPVVNPYLTLGDPVNGFDFANRDIVVNDLPTVTATNLDAFGVWYFYDTTGGLRSAESIGIRPWIDRGLLKLTTITNLETEVSNQ